MKPEGEGNQCGELLVCLCQKYGLPISEVTEGVNM